jgi:hypothetical protein
MGTNTTKDETDQQWQPEFSPWRHGGWYVDNLQYPSGAVGCISRNYPDKKWRIVCDPRPFESQPTFPNRIAAARGERDLIEALKYAERAATEFFAAEREKLIDAGDSDGLHKQDAEIKRLADIIQNHTEQYIRQIVVA